jgi:glycine dehydrogenase subunit 1
MMRVIGIRQIDELFKDVPKQKLLTRPLNLPKGLSEIELVRLMTDLSEQNGYRLVSFVGAGAYHHFSPALVSHLVSRSEFYTAYTPYQAEASQGTLQSIYEWQTFIAELCGMDVANASLYDGSTALAEGAFMAVAITRRTRLIISRTVHPEYRQVVRTYARARDLEVVEVGFKQGVTSAAELNRLISDDTAAVLVQNPNFFGQIEDLAHLSRLAHSKGALLVVCVVEPTSLGLLKPPGECGADIVVGEAQSFGNPLNFGGPGLGFLATRERWMRKIPGRLVGATVDTEGRRGFILTLQAREQHIRRERATSNICSNEALCALAATIWLAAMGPKLRQLAELNLQKAHFVYDQLIEAGFDSPFSGPFYNEFVIRCGDARRVQKELLRHDILGGVDIGPWYPRLKNHLLLCVTEMVSRRDIDRLLRIMGGLV